jgi:hypothetical protein
VSLRRARGCQWPKGNLVIFAGAPRLGEILRLVAPIKKICTSASTFTAIALMTGCVACTSGSAADVRPAIAHTSRTEPKAREARTYLRVVSCPTTFGTTPPPRPVAMPHVLAANVPNVLARTLSAYTDTSGTLLVLAPKGWLCHGDFGADGSGGIIVYPPGEHPSYSRWGGGWALPRSSPVEAVTATESGGSPTQAAGQACAYFKAAAAIAVPAFGHSCPHPRFERVRKLNATTIMFVDQPGVRGDGIPSGGENPSTGRVTYRANASPGSYRVTCTLKRAEEAVCRTVLADFRARVEGDYF